MSLEQRIKDTHAPRAPNGQPMGWSPAYLDGHHAALQAAASLAAEHDALVKMMAQALREFVDCRDEAACIDDVIPSASARAWERLAERYKQLDKDARAALAKHAEVTNAR